MKKRLLLLAMFAALIPTALSAQFLFEVTAPRDSPGFVAAQSVDGDMGPRIESIPIRLDTSLLASGPEKIAIPSFIGGEAEWLQKTGFEERQTGFVWYGGSEGDDPSHSHAMLTHADGWMIGSFWSGGRSYEVHANPQGVGRVIADAIGESQADWCGSRHPSASTDPPNTAGERMASRDSSVRSDGGHTIDVLFLVTPKAATRYWNVEAEVTALVDYANMVYANSGTNARLRLAGWEKLLLGEFDRSSKPLHDAMDKHFNALQALRRHHGADLVHIVLAGGIGNTCGLAWVLEPGWTAQDMAPFAFSYSVNSCWPWAGVLKRMTFVHEIGHQFGALHSREKMKTSSHKPVDPAAYGFLSHPKRAAGAMALPVTKNYPNAANTGAVSIMAYDPGSYWTKVPFLSGDWKKLVDINPENDELLASTYGLKAARKSDREKNTWILGDANHNVAATIDKTAPILANLSEFQYELSRAPTNVRVDARDMTHDREDPKAGTIRFDVSWEDDSTDESGFYVCVSPRLNDLDDSAPLYNIPCAAVSNGLGYGHDGFDKGPMDFVMDVPRPASFDLSRSYADDEIGYAVTVSSVNRDGPSLSDEIVISPIVVPARPRIAHRLNKAERRVRWVIRHDSNTETLDVRLRLDGTEREDLGGTLTVRQGRTTTKFETTYHLPDTIHEVDVRPRNKFGWGEKSEYVFSAP